MALGSSAKISNLEIGVLWTTFYSLLLFRACRVSPFELQLDKIRLWYNLGRNKDHSVEKCIVLPAGTWWWAEAFTALQPLLLLVSKSTAWVCETPLGLLLPPKAEELPLSSSWGWQSHGDGRWSSVLYNATERCKHFHQVAVFCFWESMTGTHYCPVWWELPSPALLAPVTVAAFLPPSQ